MSLRLLSRVTQFAIAVVGGFLAGFVPLVVLNAPLGLCALTAAIGAAAIFTVLEE